MNKGDINAFLKALFHREAGGDSKVINYAGYIGKYQFGESALFDLGYYMRDGSGVNDWKGKWLGKHGIDSRDAFLSSESNQDVAAKEWIALLCKRMKKMRLNEFIGKTIKGVPITESGIIAGAHLKGFGNDKHPGVAQFLRSGGAVDGADGLGTRVSHYVSLFAEYDLGCCKKVSLVFAEKNTGNPVADLEVHVHKNGRSLHRAKTNDGGWFPTVHGFDLEDQYQIFVKRLSGGLKLLKAGVIGDGNLTLAFLSPKSKIITSTEPHKGTPVKRKLTAMPQAERADAGKSSVAQGPVKAPPQLMTPRTPDAQGMRKEGEVVTGSAQARLDTFPVKQSEPRPSLPSTDAEPNGAACQEQKENSGAYSIDTFQVESLDKNSAIWDCIKWAPRKTTPAMA